MEKICTQVTKAAVKKVKTATEKVQSTKVKKVTTTRDNAKKTPTKTTHKKGELNEMPDTGTATQGDSGRIRAELNFTLSGFFGFV